MLSAKFMPSLPSVADSSPGRIAMERLVTAVVHASRKRQARSHLHPQSDPRSLLYSFRPRLIFSPERQLSKKPGATAVRQAALKKKLQRIRVRHEAAKSSDENDDGPGW